MIKKYTSLKKNNPSIWKSNILIAVILNLIFLCILLFLCDLKYEVSDDFIMACIMSGAYGGKYNPHMIFVNVLWGYFLLPFYRILPQISWYFVFQIVIIFISSTTISYFLLEKLEKIQAIMLSFACIMFFANDAYILVQFTKTAIFAVMAGSLLFLDALFHEKGKISIICGGVLCIIGTLIRFNVIYIAGGFLLFIILYEFVLLIRETKNKKLLKQKILKVTISGILLISIAVGAEAFNQYSYENSEDYRYFSEYNNARGKIVDYIDYGYESYREELEKIGVSETDYIMMKKWAFADNDVFTLDTMQQTAKIIVGKKSWSGWNDIIEKFQDRKITNYSVFQICMLVMVLGVFMNRKRCWTAFLVNGIAFSYILYFFIRERCVYRTEFAVFLAAFLVCIYFWDKSENDSKSWIRESILISILLCLCGGIVYLPDRTYKNIVSANKKDYIESTFFESADYDAKKYRKVINKINDSNGILEEMQENEENFYFLDFSTTIQTLYYEWKPWLNVDWGENYQYIAGIATNFPDIVEQLQKNEIENILRSLIDENVYLVDNYNVELKINYLREHYYPNARAELYKEIDGYQVWKIYEE